MAIPTDISPRETSVEELLEAMPAWLADGLVPSRVLNDATIYQLELDRIFARAWVFVGHSSEIPSRGDYVLRYIGQDAFILVRDERGNIRVLFDACRHRGAQICRAEKGNTSHFRCPYHGWTYKNTGDLVGAPAYQQAYGGMDKAEWGLISAAHVTELHGLIFATLDPSAPSLDEYLGGMRWYLDLLFNLTEDGMEVVGEPQRWIMTANWKSPAENFAGDDYHTVFLHKSMWDVGTIQIPAFANMMGYHVHAAPGHSMSFSIAPDRDDPGPKFWGYPEEVVRMFRAERVSPEQFDLAYRSRVGVGNIFPNLSFLALPLTPDPERIPPTGLMTIRQWQPAGPTKVEIWNWFLVWKGVSAEYRQLSYRAGLGTFSSSGLFEQDDAEPWQSMSRNGGSSIARTRNWLLNYKMGLRGIGGSRRVDDWPGPGVAYWPRYEEGVQRNFWRRWIDFMTCTDAYPRPGEIEDSSDV
jgi:phenylpropionate dioxygenase-like ring-hydroxylating dioxygenase large terminal subunit